MKNGSSRVGILTFYYHNYNMGGMLQAYALQKTVSDMGFTAEQISYNYLNKNTENLDKKIEKIKNKLSGKGIFQIAQFVVIKSVRKIEKLTLGKYISHKIQTRLNRFNEFEKEIPHSQRIYTSIDISHSLKEYDMFICGGDQIWNSWEGYDENYAEVFSLQFVGKNKKKFSYAASTGQPCLPKFHTERIEKGIKNLDAVSVREKSSVDDIRKMTNKGVRVVVDPVLLLDASHWNAFADKHKADEHQPYALCYILGSDNEVKKECFKFAHSLGLRTLIFPYVLNKYKSKEINWGDYADFTSGPGEFVDLIRNAEVIVTDSFHAIVFSVIFHKTFYALERASVVGGATMNSRISDFLSEYKLESRLITTKALRLMNDVTSIDYTYCDSILAKNRENSLEYLRNALCV